MLGDILPRRVAAVETFSDPPDALLYPEEEAMVCRAVASRRLDFAAGRWCARQALARLGLAAGTILAGPRGAPQWPTGVAGSITHCAGYRAAAVARAGDVASIGIDAEPDGPLPDGVREAIARPGELAALDGLMAASPGTSWDRLLFCAKESAYKAWFPLTQRWLGFKEATVSIDPAGAFTARLLVPGPVVAGSRLTEFTGRWLAAEGLIVTAIAVPARAG